MKQPSIIAGAAPAPNPNSPISPSTLLVFSILISYISLLYCCCRQRPPPKLVPPLRKKLTIAHSMAPLLLIFSSLSSAKHPCNLTSYPFIPLNHHQTFLTAASVVYLMPFHSLLVSTALLHFLISRMSRFTHSHFIRYIYTNPLSSTLSISVYIYLFVVLYVQIQNCSQERDELFPCGIGR